MDFVHLHVHTHYSILDGQASIPRLVDKAIKNGMRGMAVTDHGNMFGIKEFFNYVKKLKKKDPNLDFKPIFGCEVYCARRSMLLKEGKQDQSGWHLILLAKNEKGYHNLIKIVSHAWTDGFYSRPRTDHQELEKYREGLIVCSACLAGEVPSYIRQGNIEKAEEAVIWFKRVFGEDYYLELQRHEVKNPLQRANRETFPIQQECNKVIMELARKHGVKLVCTNDSHFVDEDNAEAHDRLICLSTGRDLDDPQRMLYSKQEWFKTKEEMYEVFSDIPEAIQNTCEVLDKVETYNIDHDPIMPNFQIPKEFGTEEEYRKKYTHEDLYNEFTQDEHGNVVLTREEGEKKIMRLGGYEKLYRIKFEADYLSKLAYDGAKRLYGDPIPENVAEQVKFELYIMKTMGFPGYFLVVQDYINVAKKELGVWVGPGRGSAAGSTVAYCLGITMVDPIKYDLLFERFLNPDRISLPDIDVDFDDDGRGKVLQWVTEKYGAERVAHIITYGTMATKLAIKDVARVQKVDLKIANDLCKAIPDRLPDGLKMNIANVIKCVPEVKEAATSPDENLRDVIKYAQMLEGNVRNTGVHACGTIICGDDISNWVPVSTADDKETKEKGRCTQYDGHVIEETGLIKMDFLGLKTLSILKEAVENVRDSMGVEINIDDIPIDDKATYQLYCDGRTVGTFQFESLGMQKYLRELQPHVFEDLIAMNALYRPGPMDYIPDFIDRKLGRKPIEYDIPIMEKYLKDTYGICVYQEQVMLLSRLLANFTRGESDTLRKAMGKKLRDKLDELKPKFINQGAGNGHDPKVLEKIWADWEKFASYAFNKSHATCYSWVAYQTAFLKANFPAQYMAGVMTRNYANISEIRKLMDESKSMGVNTYGPDVNESKMKFSVNERGDIRFGLVAVKGVGESAVQSLVGEREDNGLYKDVYDFFERVNLANCNKKSIESMILAGAFDCFGLKRDVYFAQRGNDTFLDILMRYGTKFQSDKALSANSLFGDMGMEVSVIHPEPPKEYRQWSDLERLDKEREYVGIYLSAHPLDEYSIILNHVCTTRMSQLEDREPLSKMRQITFGGIVTGVRTGVSKKGNPYGIIKMEDFEGTGELAMFGKDWMTYKNYFVEGTPLFIRARVVPNRYDNKKFDLNVMTVELLNEVKDTAVTSLTLNIPLDKITDIMVDELTDIIVGNQGNVELHFNVRSVNNMHVNLVSRKYQIAMNKDVVYFLNDHAADFDFKVNQ